MANSLREFAKKIAFRYTAIGSPKYAYGLEPIQLAAIVNVVENLKATPGAIVEIGVARGMTTRFIAEHLSNQGYDRKVYAIDTFASFMEGDVAYEISERGKRAEDLKAFGYNDYEIWKRNFADFPFVIPIRADASRFDYRSIGPFILAILDVDLYLPTKRALPKVYETLVPGGVILVDDCAPNSQWDGALQAYTEFVAEIGAVGEFIGTKCGVIRKK